MQWTTISYRLMLTYGSRFCKTVHGQKLGCVRHQLTRMLKLPLPHVVSVVIEHCCQTY